MKPVIQEQKTGCAIASAAAIAGISYQQAKQTANQLGIFAEDESIWSSTQPIRDLLTELGFKTSVDEQAFTDWTSLPDCALLAIKWHQRNNKDYWHWVVFHRQAGEMEVLDSSRRLKQPIRTDFYRMKPKWFIEVIR